MVEWYQPAAASGLSAFALVTRATPRCRSPMLEHSDHLAPEIWNNGGTSVRSDIWALGMTLHRLIHGAGWYSRLPAAPRDVIRRGGFAYKLPRLPHVPDSWRRVVRKMMHDDMGLRYQNAHEVMNALASLSSEPSWSCEVTPAEIRWMIEAKGRKRFVSWLMYSARKHEWMAWSEALAQGKRYRLGESNKVVSSSEAERQLKAFFSK
jgi:serine/threonine protein kinase